MASPSEQLDLGALRALEAKATPAPWAPEDCGVYVAASGEDFAAQCRNANLVVALRNAAPALLAAAGERDALRAEVKRRELHMHRMLALVGRALEGQHVSKEFGGNAPEDVQGLLDQAFVLHQKHAALQAEVDACGAIIGQPPGAKSGHAEIIDATIKEHQAANAKLHAEVERLRAGIDRVACMIPLHADGAKNALHEIGMLLHGTNAALAPAAAKEVR